MIFSKEQLFSDGQEVTATAVSTNVIDLGATGTVLNAPAALVRDIGKGRPIPIVVSLDADADDAADTLVVTLEMDTVENFASATVVATGATLTGGSAGDSISLHFIPEGLNERYMRLNYTVTGATPSYTLTSGIVLADQTNDAGPGV